jgi:hypothetical protein
MDCPICYENLRDESEKYKLSCKHTFHEECLKKWLKISNDNNNQLGCPYCREPIKKPVITYKNKSVNLIYKTIQLKRKTCIINGETTCFIVKQLQDQIPKAWMDIYNKILNPLFKLVTNNESIYITSFLRSYLLITNRKDNIVLLEKEDVFGEKYYDLETDCKIAGIFTNKMFNICFDWCYEVLQYIKRDYNIYYGLFYNTILNDLALNTMINLNLQNNKNMFQAIYASSMYTLLNKFNYLNKQNAILPDIKEFKFICYNIYTKEQLQSIIDYQKKYLDNSITLLKSQ